MARNTSVSLGDHFTRFIDEQVESGRYGSASEVVREGLRLLEDRERERLWLREQIAEADAQYKAGNVHDDSEELWTELDRQVDERVRRGDRPSPHVCQ